MYKAQYGTNEPSHLNEEIELHGIVHNPRRYS